MTRTLNEYPYTKATARFVRESAQHQMTVLHDDGLYRHLSFRNSEHGWNMWFDLITFPGGLVFQGDGDSFMFRRLDDMFEFFRQPGGAAINPSYWSEKLVGPGGERQAMTYQQEMLTRQVAEAVAEAVRRDPEILSGLADAVRDRVTDELVDNESIDRQVVEQFRYWANPDDRFAYPSKAPDFEFGDVWEWRTRDYHWWFLWACNAIVWGIAKYDAHKSASPTAPAVVDVHLPAEEPSRG